MKSKYIFIILLAALVIRLYNITFPVSGWHSWRQSDTASIAKNFYENGFRLLYPQIEWRGNTPGYVESEFHIYPFAVAILYKFFGFDDMWGRILSVIFSLLTIYGIYLLTRKIISENTALWTAFIYSIIPLNTFYSRAFMPESLLLLCSVFAIYFFYKWIEDENFNFIVFSYVFLTLAVLIKIPTLYLGLPLLFLSYIKFSGSFILNWRLWLYTILMIIPVVLWYDHAHNLYQQTGLTFKIWDIGKDKWGNIDLLFSLKFYNDVFFKNIVERHLTYALLIPFILGLFIKREKKIEYLFDWWLLSVVIYILIVARGNQLHEYYNLPFILPAVVFISKSFSKYFDLTILKRRSIKPTIHWLFLLFLILTLILSYLRYERLLNSESHTSTVFSVSKSVNEIIPDSSLIIAVDQGNPIVLYQCNRRGWNAYVEQIDSVFLSQRIKKGAKYLIGELSYFNSKEKEEKLKYLLTNYKTLKKTSEYFILLL